MRNMNRWLVCLLLVCTCACVLSLAGCDTIAGVINPHEHTVVKHEGQEPTCLEDGWAPYETCSSCNGYSTYMLISALGHDYGSDYRQNGDVHSIFCTRCDKTIDQLHSWKKSVMTKEPTCTDAGEQSYVCTVCSAEKTETVASHGHDYTSKYQPNGDVHSIICLACSDRIDKPHSWDNGMLTKAPTCTDDGVLSYTCTDCSAKSTEKVAELGHDFSEKYQPNGDVHSLFCSGCTETVDQPHNWQRGELKAPTCTAPGEQLYVCSVCDDERSESVSALGHDFAEEYKPNGDDVHSLFCSGCAETVDQPHEWEEGRVTKDSTCGDTGIMTYTCLVCEHKKNETIPATGEHFDGEWEIVSSPTAIADGLKVRRCINCPTVIAEQVLSADVKSMPIMYMIGDYTAATAAKNEVEMQFSYVEPEGGQSFDGFATIKVQGASSVAYAKKNYTIKLYKDDTFDGKLKVDLGWGKENKYVMKANWVDFIQARNVVACRLWGDMVLSRNHSATQERLAALPTNGGAIDGYPIAVFMNGEFHGIYTMNVPKDEWMFGMDDSETEALMGADDWNNTNFSSLIGYFKENSAGDLVTDGWELKYCGSDDVTWVTDSFNALIRFCWDNEGEAFKAGISNHLDIDAAIDYLIYMYVIYMRDNSSKNILWATYDGKIWIPSVYDQDGILGMVWDGKRYGYAHESLPELNSDGIIDVGFNFGPSSDHLYEGKNFILWDRIWNAYTEEILIRYKELRETTLSESNMIAELEKFRDCIPESVYKADIERWYSDRIEWWGNNSGAYYERFDYEYTYQWISDRLYYVDDAMRDIYTNAYLPNASTPAPELK